MRSATISLLAVDESHCISQVYITVLYLSDIRLLKGFLSQWGASFRPDYLKISRFAEEFNVERYQVCDLLVEFCRNSTSQMPLFDGYCHP